MKTHVMSFLNARVRMLVPLAATLTIVLGAGLAPDAAHAQTCHNVLQGHVDWAAGMADGPGDYYVDFAMVSNQLGLNATFAEGTLTHKFSLIGNLLSGSGKQYFSKQRWGPAVNPTQNPFNPSQAANIKVSLNASLSKATLFLTGATYTFDLTCDHPGVLHGVGNP